MSLHYVIFVVKAYTTVRQKSMLDVTDSNSNSNEDKKHGGIALFTFRRGST
jgi:hypothetical protein